MITDALRPPPVLDPTAGAYKDWLHLNVFDHASGCIGIFNASLHGAPGDARSRAIGTALVHVPGRGWVGNVEVGSLREASIGTSSISLARVAVATDPAAGSALASARLASDGLEAGLTADFGSRPIEVDLPLPFGTGWISWYAVPRASVLGGLSIDDAALDLSRASAYHDHNWGRWHWGDDIGWKWGACHAESPEMTIVVSRATNRDHSDSSGTMVVVDVAGERRSFSGASVEIACAGSSSAPLRRMPGALAALHQDRIAPRLPRRIDVRADDGIDGVELTFAPRAAAQLIAGDPVKRGYGFLHELVGAFDAVCRISGRTTRASGLAVFEHVD